MSLNMFTIDEEAEYENGTICSSAIENSAENENSHLIELNKSEINSKLDLGSSDLNFSNLSYIQDEIDDVPHLRLSGSESHVLEQECDLDDSAETNEYTTQIEISAK